MGEKDFQLGEVHRDIVNENGIAVAVTGGGENRSPGVKHDRDAVGFRGAVDDLQFLYPVQIVIGKKQLVRRMNLDHLDFQPQDLFHIGKDVVGLAGMQSTTGNKPLGIFFHVIGDILVHAGSEADDLRTDIVDEHGAV